MSYKVKTCILHSVMHMNGMKPNPTPTLQLGPTDLFTNYFFINK